MCSIDWCAFTWQAFATLVTGVAATGGAIFIGTRQLAINRAQVKVAAGQARIANIQAVTARMAQRSALFEKRYAVYTAIQDYIRKSMYVKNEDWMTLPLEPLQEALQKARFLFPPSVRSSLADALDAADEFAETTHDLQKNGPYPSRDDPRRVNRSAKRKIVRERLNALSELMGEEMRLYSDTSDLVPLDDQAGE